MSRAGDEDAFDGWRIAGILLALVWSYVCWAALWIGIGCLAAWHLSDVMMALWP